MVMMGYVAKPQPIMLIFYLLRFWAMLKTFAFMLNIMPMTTAVMPVCIYDCIVLND